MVLQYHEHLLTVWLQNRTFLRLQKKWAQKRESCYQAKYLKTVVERVFFLWLLKASHPQIQTSRWLPEMLWNQQAACVGHIILVSWPLDSHIDFYFIWFWSKAIGEDFKVTGDLWTSMMAFWGILSTRGDKGRNSHSFTFQWKKDIMTSFVVSVSATTASCWGCTEKRWCCWKGKNVLKSVQQWHCLFFLCVFFFFIYLFLTAHSHSWWRPPLWLCVLHSSSHEL